MFVKFDRNVTINDFQLQQAQNIQLTNRTNVIIKNTFKLLRHFLFIFGQSYISTTKAKTASIKKKKKKAPSKPWDLHLWKTNVHKKKTMRVTEYVTVWFTELTTSDNEGNKGPSSKQNI